ncbi:unnamed protein product [Discosporangium mesarthrocarpum]
MLVDLEGQVVTGRARSTHRRLYASTLHCSPVILSFLAAAMAAVEAFVLEWGAGEGSSAQVSPYAQERAQEAPGGDFPHGRVGSLLPISVPESHGADLGGSGKATAEKEVHKQGSTLMRGLVAAGPGGSSSAGGEKRARGMHDSRSTSSSRRLYFLRRLSAVVGSLELCVASSRNGGGGVSKGNGTRKGFLQALTELAAFLETRAARDGFGGVV